MFTLNINNYSDENGSQTCSYEILDSACNRVYSANTAYVSNAKKYLETYFTKNIQIISGKGNVYNNTEIKFELAS